MPFIVCSFIMKLEHYRKRNSIPRIVTFHLLYQYAHCAKNRLFAQYFQSVWSKRLKFQLFSSHSWSNRNRKSSANWHSENKDKTYLCRSCHISFGSMKERFLWVLFIQMNKINTIFREITMGSRRNNDEIWLKLKFSLICEKMNSETEIGINLKIKINANLFAQH